MTTPTTKSIAATLVAACLSCSAYAVNTVTNTISSTAPSSGVVQEFVPTGSTGGFAWRADTSVATAPWRDLGQTFTAQSNFTLDVITLRSNLTSTANSPVLNAGISVTIYSFSSIFANTPSATLGTFTGVTASGSNVPAGSYLTFSLSSGIAMTQGNVYGFVLHYDSMANGRSLPLSVALTSEYAAGRNIFSESDGSVAPSSATFTRGSTPLEFHLISNSIPEPGACAALTGAGALMIVLTSRRHRR